MTRSFRKANLAKSLLLAAGSNAQFTRERTSQDAAAQRPRSIARLSGATTRYAAGTANSTLQLGAPMPVRSERAKHRIINRGTAGCIELHCLHRNFANEGAGTHQVLP